MLRLGTAIAVLFLVICAADARADSVLQVKSFNTTTGPVGVGLIALEPFDESLGTLHSVTVSISGMATALVQAPLILGSQNTPQPVLLAGEIRHDFDRIGGQFFDFGGSARTIFQQPVLAGGQAVQVVRPFQYDFSFTPTTDLFGGNVVPTVGFGAIPPFWAQALVSDFLEPYPGALNQVALRQEVFSLTGAAVPLSLTTLGQITITYQFDRAVTPPPIPEPGTLVLLLGAAGVGAVWRRRRSGRIRGDRIR